MYDLLLKGGRVVDPAQGIDAVRDVAFSDGKVAAVEEQIDDASAADIRLVSGLIVTPGLIDLHTDVYWGATSLGVRPEAVARRSGTTTLVDAGSAGPGNFAGLKSFLIDPATVRILAYLNISFAGIFGAVAPSVAKWSASAPTFGCWMPWRVWMLPKRIVTSWSVSKSGLAEWQVARVALPRLILVWKWRGNWTCRS